MLAIEARAKWLRYFANAYKLYFGFIKCVFVLSKRFAQHQVSPVQKAQCHSNAIQISRKLAEQCQSPMKISTHRPLPQYRQYDNAKLAEQCPRRIIDRCRNTASTTT